MNHHIVRFVFNPDDHLIDLETGEWLQMREEDGAALPGCEGVRGPVAISRASGHEIGLDLIRLQPGASFPMHTHPGDHILVAIEGAFDVSIGGTDWRVEQGRAIYIPADQPHNVKTIPGNSRPIKFLAFGHPHRDVDATDRMHKVE